MNFFVACQRGCAEEVIRFIEEGFDVNRARNETQWPPLILTCMSGQTGIFRILIEAGSDVNFQDFIGWTALHYASQFYHVDIIRQLLAAGADTNIRNHDGITALMLASNRGCIEIVRQLLEAGADVNITDNMGQTAIDKAEFPEVRGMLVKARDENDYILK